MKQVWWLSIQMSRRAGPDGQPVRGRAEHVGVVQPIKSGVHHKFFIRPGHFPPLPVYWTTTSFFATAACRQFRWLPLLRYAPFQSALPYQNSSTSPPPVCKFCSVDAASIQPRTGRVTSTR
jgi:hypothetical protein